MPPNHQQFYKWDGNRLRSAASEVGNNTAAVVGSILSSHRAGQQGYKSCLSLLKLAERHGPEQLEKACGKALEYTSSPSLKVVQAVLRMPAAPLLTDNSNQLQEASEYSFTRGSEYYSKEDA
jgi:hypothetical protein